MMRFRLSFVCLFFVAMFLMSFPDLVQASGSQETLNQYVSDLQKNPTDQALREKIIKLALEMKPSPPVPKEAERFMVRGAAAMESAKDPKDFKDAVSEFEKATLIAPWFANAYYNLGVAQDKAGLYEDAGKNLKLYLLAAPNAVDANEVEKLIYKIEYRQEKAAKEANPETIAANKQNEFDDLLKKIDGRRYFCPISGAVGYAQTIDVRGKFFNLGLIDPTPGRGGWDDYSGRADGHFEIRGYETTWRIPYEGPNGIPLDAASRQTWTVEETYVISEDGGTITVHGLQNTGEETKDRIFTWHKSL